MMKKFDLIIIGAGPAGMACALMLQHSGLSIAVLEKEHFPRDKICGDALSLDVINQLSLISPELKNRFDNLAARFPCPGVTIISPGGHELELPFYQNGERKHGYICERLVFDNMLFEELTKSESVTVLQDTKVKDVLVSENEVLVYTEEEVLTATMLAGADGANSVVRRRLLSSYTDRKHYCAGLRQYFSNVEGMNSEGFIELHFFPGLLPGYLWIFPMTDGKANVGIGLLASEIVRQKTDIKREFNRLIYEHPRLRERFRNAKPLEPVRGFGLPLGSQKTLRSGNRFLLLGDAAALIDPFTGDGIPNAIRSGRIAAGIIVKAFGANDFSLRFLGSYDREINKRIGDELRVSQKIQQLARSGWLFDFVVKRAGRSKGLSEYFAGSMVDLNKKRALAGPRLFFSALFR